MDTRPQSICVTLFAAIFFAAFLSTAHAQQSPTHGIRFSDPSGYTTVGNRWIRRHANKVAAQHGEQAGASFTQNGHELQAFPLWLDSIWDEVRAEFGRCYDVSRLSPSMVHVSIEDLPFPVDGYPAGFRASGTTDQSGTIRIVYWNWRNDIGGQHAVDLTRGELRNFFYWKLTGQPREMWGIEVCK